MENPERYPQVKDIKTLEDVLEDVDKKLVINIFKELKKKGYAVQFDESGSIGKRYRRQDEIGTPLCFTYDFDSEKDSTITARSRDTMAQERISIDKVERAQTSESQIS